MRTRGKFWKSIYGPEVIVATIDSVDCFTGVQVNGTSIGSGYLVKSSFEPIDFWATREHCKIMNENNPKVNRCICTYCDDKESLYTD